MRMVGSEAGVVAQAGCRSPGSVFRRFPERLRAPVAMGQRAPSQAAALVTIPRGELIWAEEKMRDATTESTSSSMSGLVTRQECEVAEAEHVRPFVEAYVGGGFLTDEVVQILEDGSWNFFPLDYPCNHCLEGD